MPIGKSRGRPNSGNRVGKPKYTTESLKAQLQRYNREPFLDLLAAWMQCAPQPEDVAKFAKENPDKYVQALTHIARLGGFTEKREVDHTLTVHVKEMSDSQLEDKLRNLHKMLDLNKGEDYKEIEVSPSSVGNSDAHPASPPIMSEKNS